MLSNRSVHAVAGSYSREVLKCDPRSTRSIRSIRSTDCSVIPKAEGLFRTAFRTISHSWMLGMSVICFRSQILLQLIICSSRRGQKEVILPRLHRPIFRVLKMSNYTAACIIKAVSRLLPNYESRTWDAKTRKLLSYQIVISGKIQYFRTFF